jgi:phage shock protein PspC (stress-responsive transcriptional regulator)/outer membrane lipopolysaccharide assembly protein LptE/RlpB
MKKTISINISGILFHIEEDGYLVLKNYLDAINQHFSSYNDNQEIVLDIENRIAEIFLSNLKNNKQVITAENVTQLIEKMGTITDFKALDEETLSNPQETENPEANDFYKYITPPSAEKTGYKKLSRLEKRKIIGGVCAGIAHHLSIDVLWTRLIALLLLFTSLNINFQVWPWQQHLGLGTWVTIIYIILWAILPVSQEEPEDKNIKKLYRNPDDRAIGGVASGLAAYFNIEVIWARLIFIGLVFAGGAGLVIYTILWIITPLAKSITERIEMKGEPITLDNIENTIKENLNPGFQKEESQNRKILMTPFRILGNVINEIGKALGPIGKVILMLFRVVFGLFILFMGAVITFSAILALGVYWELIPQNFNGEVWVNQIPSDWISEIVPLWLAISVATAMVIPGILLMIAGISVMVKKIIIDSRFAIIVIVLWLASLAACAFQIPHIVMMFNSSATETIEQPINLGDEVLVLKANNKDELFPDIDWISLKIDGTSSTQAQLITKLKANGKTTQEALATAKEISYTFEVQDSIIIFDRNISITNKFRGQEVQLLLEIPYNKPFVMDRSLLPILESTIHKNGYKTRDVDPTNFWVFNENGLLCLNCESDFKVSATDSLSRAKFEGAYFMKK